MAHTLPYGSWPSPFTAADVAAGSHPVDAARFVGDEIWWSERLPAESSRTALRRRTPDGAHETLLPAPWNIGSRVHEYGGLAWTTDEAGTAYFVEKSDQRLWAFTPGEDPRPLTPEGAGMRFAEPAVIDLPGMGPAILATRETHIADAAPRRDIVAVPVDGRAADDADALAVLAHGTDFVAYPRLSPDGRQLAWVSWDHPDMPWDASRLRVTELTPAGGAGETRILAGAEGGVSVLQPEWVVGADGRPALVYSSDVSGRWNLRSLTWTADGAARDEPIVELDADIGGPLWSVGSCWFAPLHDGRLFAVAVNGSDELLVIDLHRSSEPDTDSHPATDSGPAMEPIHGGITARAQVQDASGTRVLVTGAGRDDFGGLWLLDLAESTPAPSLIRSNSDGEIDPRWLSSARPITVDGPHGPVHAFAYPPTNPEVDAPEDELPPYLVLVHGGPTGHVGGEASTLTAYFTSRGIGVLDVNYGGSSGYGRAYRERLRGSWGIVDRDDVVAAASGIADAGIADPARLAIRGGSAGGWTVLCALTATDRFAAGISRYGVADLRALAADTHDFEARYLDGLVGPLPAAEDVYVERSPLSHLERFTTPMLIEQGMDDLVVPPAQSEAVRDALASRGIPHAYLPFEGEGHGFRRADTIQRSLEAELSFLGQVLGFETPGVPVLPLETTSTD